jgi:DNA-binding PadR family transcriptional regulator
LQIYPLWIYSAVQEKSNVTSQEQPRSAAGIAAPAQRCGFSILLALSGGKKHGYAIMKEVAEADGGSLKMGPGTLYGSLDRMIRAELVEESGRSDDERRRYYHITRFGRKVLGAELARLNHTLKAARRKGIIPTGEPA